MEKITFHHQLLIMDDVTAYLKQKENIDLLIELATNRAITIYQLFYSFNFAINTETNQIFTTSCIFLKLQII